MRLSSGSMVRDNVRLVRRLSEGSMGEVWVAEHLGLRTEVAVKFIHSDLARKQPMMLERFEREAKAAAQIKSPHVVRTFDTGVMQDGTPFIVMELLSGQSLGELLRRGGPLDPRPVCEVVVQVSRALSVAHELGIVHRDIKPDNIFLATGMSATGEQATVAKLLDFGIAKTATVSETGTRLTRDGNLVGTPAYMSREQIMASGEVDAQADLWALSVCAYEALTGRLPFEGSTIGLTCIAICEGELTPPSGLVAGMPAELDAFFRRAFDADPAARFATAKALALGLLVCFSQLASEAESLLQAFEHSGKFSLPPAPLQPAAKTSAAGLHERNIASLAGDLPDDTHSSEPPGSVGWPRAAVVALGAAGVVVLLLIALVARLLLRDDATAVSGPNPPVASSYIATQTATAKPRNMTATASTSRSSAVPTTGNSTAAAAGATTRQKPSRRQGSTPPAGTTLRPEDELGF